MTTSVEVPRTSWIPDDSTFGARLALVRQRMGWGNVKEAADACSVPVESWRRWERDGRKPRDVAEEAGKIADRTGCDYDWLIRGRRRVVSVHGAAPGEPYAGGEGVTPLYPEPSVRPTRNVSRPPGHPPNGHPDGGTGPGNHRTSRTPRSAAGTRP